MKKKTLIAGVMFAAMGAAAGSAHAVPIVIEFVGTAERTRSIDWLNGELLVDDASWDDALLGQAVTGRITIETDGLSEDTFSTTGFTNFRFYNPSSDPLRLISSELSIGGVTYFMDAYPYQSGSIGMHDTETVLFSDSISIQHNYFQGPTNPVVDGQYFVNGVLLRWRDPDDPYGLIDSSLDFDLLSMAATLNSLPISGQYMTTTLGCLEGACASITQSHTTFLISSFQVHTASVPEPGTLGLFAAGLLGAGLVRRRRQHGV